MRYARKENGQRLFQVDEFLTAQQIQGYFSRTAAKLKHATSQSAHVTDDNDLLAAQEEEAFSSARASILDQCQLVHPIVYDTLNICSLYTSNKLTKLSVAQLRSICDFYNMDIEAQSSKRKAPYISFISDLVGSCSCTRRKGRGSKSSTNINTVSPESKRITEEEEPVLQDLAPVAISPTSSDPGDKVLSALNMTDKLGSKMEEFLVNFQRWQTNWQLAKKELPRNLLLALDVCDENASPNIHRLLLIVCTLPVSSAEAEWSLSLMKLSKERFSYLAVIAMHYSQRFEGDERDTETVEQKKDDKKSVDEKKGDKVADQTQGRDILKIIDSDSSDEDEEGNGNSRE
ncbi:hypothetical protein ACROYT_G014612 [Oculina patagonica]